MSAAAFPTNTKQQAGIGQLFKPALAIGISLLIVLAIGSISDLGIHAKVAFITFGLAIVGWTLTDINDTYIALVAAIVFAATGIDAPSEFFETLGDPLIWLMFASFMIAAAVKASGLSERLAVFVARRAKSVRQLFILLTLVLILTAFLVPSTSGRAALMLPVFLAIRAVMPNERVARGLALLFPSIILLSAISSLIGAGAHLITADILLRTGGEYLGFGRWLLMGLPFALASSFAATFTIMHLFMNRSDRALPLNLSDDGVAQRKPWGRAEIYVAVGATVLIALWATETVHGINSTLIALIGALLLTAPFLRIISFKNAIKEVDWGMLVFMAATLELGEALIESGGAQWIVTNLFTVFDGPIAQNPLITVTLVAGFGLLSHLVITSRSSRASVITPLVILLATALGFSPTTFAFMTAAATGFCLTLPVSAKPVAMFAQAEGPTYTPRDLLRLSSALLPIHLVLLVAFAFVVWPALGLDIGQSRLIEAPLAPDWDSSAPRQIIPAMPVFDLGPKPQSPHKDALQLGGRSPSGIDVTGALSGVSGSSPVDLSRDSVFDAASNSAILTDRQAQAADAAQPAQQPAAQPAQQPAAPAPIAVQQPPQPPPQIEDDDDD